MPDEPRRGGPGPGGDQAPQEDQPTGRRRRSLDGGGLSVSDLLEQHSRTNIPRPVPPGQSDTGRRAAPEPEPPRRPAPPQNGRHAPEGTGRRAAPEPPRRQAPPAPEDTGTRPRPPANGAPPTAGRRPTAPPAPPANDFFAAAGEGTGTRTPRPVPEDTGTRRRPEEPPARPRPTPPPPNGTANGYAGRPDDLDPRRPAPPRPAAPGEVPGEPSRRFPANGRPRPEDGPRVPSDPAAARRPAEGTGQRPRPDVPGTPPGRRLPDGSGPRPRPEGLAPDTPRRSADGSGPRPRPEDLAPDAPRRLAEGSGPRPRPEDAPRRLPDSSGPRQRPEDPVDGHRRRPDEVGPPGRRAAAEGAAAEGIGRRLADGPRPGEHTGQRPRPGIPADGSRRLPDGSGPRPRPDAPVGDAPRRLADGSGPHDVTGGPRPGRRPRPAPDDLAVDPRRPAEGPRRLADGPPVPPVDGPRRLADGPPVPVDGAGPRRLADGPVDGPRPGDAPGRRFADDGAPAPDQAPPVIADRLNGGLNGSGPEPREAIDPASLTTEMEAISDDVKKRREVDHTLARFSAVHDELAEQERLRKERRQKLMPWKADHDEDATEYASPVESPDDDGPRRRGRTAKHSKIVRTIKVVALAAAVLVFVSTGLGWGAMFYIDSKIPEIDALNQNSAAVHEAEKQLGDENFLIVGSDTRAGARPEDGVGDANFEPGARSDVLMLAHIPADRKRMVVVSVPRDLLIKRPQCEKWDPGTGEYTGEQLDAEEDVKANEPYAVGGPKCVSKFMTELTGLEINHFISVDFNGFKGMVDAIGTVPVCVPKPMKDDELGVIFDQAGRFEIDGTKALDYVRARKVSGENKTDFDRVNRQQQFLSSLLRKALSSEILLNPGKLNAFLNAFAAAAVGQNIGVNDMLTLAQSLQSLEAGRVTFVTIPHETSEGPTKSNDDNQELLKEADTKALFQAIIDGTPLPEETPDNAPADQNQAAGQTQAASPPPGPKQGKVIDHKGIKIQVRNGDPDNAGAARRTTDALRQLGYDVVLPGDAPAAEKTVILYGVGGEDAATTLASSVPGATLQFQQNMGGAVQLLIGPGWDEEILAPQAPGSDPGKAAPPEKLEVVNAAKDPCA
ncbi:LCP family protein [Saccharothrix carnea]|uniref:LCP family protein n=1 Tax=Saccharothrix carnea TaxID=1280637 RepID=UPI0011B2767C|nr:LCP family protein [Saccharothrix carnea]